MKKTMTVRIPVEMECKVEYYILDKGFMDGDSWTVLENKYFETEEEAINYFKEVAEHKGSWWSADLYGEVTPLDEKYADCGYGFKVKKLK